MKLQKLLCGYTLCAGVILAMFLLGGCKKLQDQPYATFYSPDKLHKLEVYPYKTTSLSPGHGGDAEGTVFLKDHMGNVIRQQHVEMVQQIESPEWSSGHVSVKLILDWKF